MSTRKVISFFTLVTATSFAYAEYSSFLNNRVFPNDDHWSPIYAKRKLENLEKEDNSPNYKICQTKECEIIAKEFLSSMNKSIDPCEDFYDFACSKWSTDIIPPGQPTWSRYMIFKNTVEHRVKGILETKIELSDLLPVRQAKKWYLSCMDTDTLEDRGIKPIESILIRGGGWPIAMDKEEWDPEGNTWQNVERYYTRLTGDSTFYRIRAHPSSDEEFGLLELKTPKIPLSDLLPLKYRNYSGNDYNEYVQLVTKVADVFVQHNNADVSKERLMKEAKEIVEFEKEIYELSNRGRNYEMMTMEEFYDWYETNETIDGTEPNGKIDWQLLIQELFEPVNIEINPDSTLYVENLEFVRNIGKLLATTPKRTIVNYIHWRFVGNMLPYTTEEMRNDLFELVSEEYGVKERPPRWRECLSGMKLVHATSYEFVGKYFTNHTKKTALEMIENIQRGMEVQIENSNWLDTESKEWAKDKLRSMKIFVGFPDWYKNKTALVNYYKGLSIGSDFFENVLSYMRYDMRKDLKSYKDKDSDDPYPAVDFQAPLFTPKLPDYINYGIAGVIVGHEMSHGFDDTGIQFGKSQNASTLSESVLKNYYQRADCFLDQYDEYYGETNEAETEEISDESKRHMPKMSVITRGENIADTTGLQSVFQAYHKFKKPETGGWRLPGLEEFTDDQMFFLSFASTWCQIETQQYETKRKMAMDSHSPGKYRVLGSVSNTKDFAKVFNCPVGSPMNPTNKCNIWEKPNETQKTKKSALKSKHDDRWEGQWKI